MPSWDSNPRPLDRQSYALRSIHTKLQQLARRAIATCSVINLTSRSPIILPNKIIVRTKDSDNVFLRFYLLCIYFLLAHAVCLNVHATQRGSLQASVTPSLSFLHAYGRNAGCQLCIVVCKLVHSVLYYLSPFTVQLHVMQRTYGISKAFLSVSPSVRPSVKRVYVAPNPPSKGAAYKREVAKFEQYNLR